ncbi:MAG: hypothetical protein F6K30_12500 [Cyanothece sp. SIO2G6]|nr:hypothetical protein [Cyanothece sp. SIO2G6]
MKSFQITNYGYMNRDWWGTGQKITINGTVTWGNTDLRKSKATKIRKAAKSKWELGFGATGENTPGNKNAKANIAGNS